LRYTARVPTEATDGDQLRFDGEVRTPRGERPIGGQASATVVADLFERITATGDVDESDLRTAYSRFQKGELTNEQLDRIHRAWLRSERGETDVEPRVDD
ncbi:MAG: hypothetical protein ABEJ40_01325, partial [Haloarculaceae archaeon]